MTRDEVVADGLERPEWAEKFLRMSRAAVWRLMKSGQLPYVKLGRSRRVPRRAVIEFAARKVENVS